MRKENQGLKRLPLTPRGSTFDKRIGTLDWVLFGVLLLYALVVLYPFYNAFIISVSSNQAYLNSDGLMLWPKEFTLEAYQRVFSDSSLWGGLKITLVLLIVGTAYQLFFTVITGYALSREDWLGKNFVMNMIIVTMFFGGGLIPYFILITNYLQLDNNILVMIIPGAIDTYNMLLMRNYFKSLPADMEESAKIDGANDIEIFFKIYLPLSLPMLATIGLFFAVGNWNSWYNSVLFIEKQELKPLQHVLRELIVTNSSSIPGMESQVVAENLKMSAIFFTIVPMMCFYPFLQRFFVKGIVVGAIKG